MIIGVKYCGGCNPRYDRGANVERLKKQFYMHSFVSALEDQDYDIVLLVNGCQTACAAKNHLIAEKGIFSLTDMRSFNEFSQYLSQFDQVNNLKFQTEGNNLKSKADMKKRLHIGDTASMNKVFYRDDVEKFSLLTGDRNRVHYDMNFAMRLDFDRPIVHGVLVGSLISTVMGMQLPGDGTVFMGEQLTFSKPVYYGDSITARVKFVSCREFETYYIGNFYGECINQREELVVHGLCRQLIKKEIFEIENPAERANECFSE